MTAAAKAEPAGWPVCYFLITAFIPGHLLSWGVEWVFALMSTVAGVVAYPAFHARYPSLSRRGLLAVAALTLVSLFSYIATLLSGRFATGPRDWTDLVRPFLIYFSVTLGFSYGRLTLSAARRATLIVLLFSLCAALALILQVPVLSTAIDGIYSSTKTAIGIGTLRVSIPFENPNFLGFFSVISLACALLFGALPSYGVAVVCIAVIAITGSRTAWVTALIVVVVFLASMIAAAFGPGSSGSRTRIAAPFAISIAAVGAAFPWLRSIWENNQRFLDFLEGILTLQLLNEASYVERQEMRAQALQLISERLWLGWGALKQSDMDVIDNQYVSLMLRGGVLGAGVVISAVGGALVMHIRAQVSTTRRAQTLVLWIIVLAWMWSGQFIENVRLAALATMMLGATVAHDA